MEYPPPNSLVYSGIQFNPALFEIDAVNNVFDQATIATLNTDNIQGIAPADTISLYTLSTGVVNLGSSLLSTIRTWATDFAMYGNLSIRNFAGTQVIGYTLHIANIVAQVFYADSTTPTITANLSITPNTVGDVISGNGNFIVNSGESRFVSLRLNKFQAPLHYFYNAAATLYKRMSYTANSISEVCFCDTANITIPSSAVSVTPDTLTPTVGYTGIYTIQSGKLNLNTATSITAGAPIIPDYIPVYSATNGVNVVGAIGYSYVGVQSIAPLALLTSGSGTNYFTVITGIPAGVWIVCAACRYDIILATNLSRQYLAISTGLTIPTHENMIVSSTTGTSPIISVTQLAFTCVINATAAWSCGCSISLTFSVAGAIQIPSAGTNNTSYLRITRIA